MKPKAYILFTCLIPLAVLLVACGAQAGGSTSGGTPTPLPPVTASGTVVVDGRVVPSDTVDLAFNTNGEVAEVLAEEGDSVKAGDVIARLGNREALESNVANAQMDLLSAQQELLDAQQAKQDLTDNLPQAQTDSLQALKDSLQAVKDAQRKVDGLVTQATGPDLLEAKATHVLTKDKLDKANKDYDQVNHSGVKNVLQAALLNRVAQAQRDYDNAVRRYNNLLTGSTEFSRTQAQYELDIAKARLAQAQKDYNTLQNGPKPEDVALADKRIETAQGHITAAEAAIKSTQAALTDLDLVAPMAGTITKLNLTKGQQVTPGTTVAEIADLVHWYVDTDNLTEIEVVDVAPGQKVTITPDALTDLKLNGIVEKISNTFEEKRGDVTYTVHILLNDADPQLRWGMTTSVTFEKGK